MEIIKERACVLAFWSAKPLGACPTNFLGSQVIGNKSMFFVERFTDTIMLLNKINTFLFTCTIIYFIGGL